MTGYPRTLPDFTSQDATGYKTRIDTIAALHDRLAGAFSVQAQDRPDMTVHVTAGWIGGATATVPTEVAAQNTGTITAPEGDPRKDIVYIDASSGAVGVATGTPAATPADPAVPEGKIAVARINLTDGMTEITNADIDDLRTVALVGGSAGAASESAAGIVELATSAEVATGSDTARAVTPAGVAANYIGQGKHEIYVPASAMLPTVSNGCAALARRETTAGRPDLAWLLFDAAADEHAQFQIAMPPSWDEGPITFQVEWSTLASDGDGVAWGLQAVAVGDGDTADVAYGTAVVVADNAQSAAEDVLVSAESGALTVGGTPAAGKLTYFRVFRDVSDGNDNMTEDAGLLGIRIFYTVNARTDA